MRKSTSAALAPKPYKSAARDPKRGARVDAELAFLLARQTLLEVELLIKRLGTAKTGGPPLLGLQAERGAAQLSSVAVRLKALARSRDLSRRFEAEEMLIRIHGLEDALRLLEPPSLNTEPTPLTAAQVKEMLTARIPRAKVRSR